MVGRVQAMRKVSTFIDVERIDSDALPAIAADMSAGDRSLITAAFGELHMCIHTCKM